MFLRVERTVDRQTRPVEDMRIDHRRRNIGVTEQVLNGANIRARFEQVRRMRMPQRVHRLPANSGRRGSFIGITRSMSVV